MRRRPLALACVFSADGPPPPDTAQYQQPYSMYGTAPQSSPMYAGYGQNAMYGQGAMPSFGPQSGMEQSWAGRGMASQAAYQLGGSPLGDYGQQVHYSGRATPPMKLPPGVHSENGVLYYDGKAYADSNYSQPSPFYPVRCADRETVESQGPMQSVMDQSGGYGGMPEQGPMGDGQGCAKWLLPKRSLRPLRQLPARSGGAPDVFGRPRNAMNPFPGKYGYVWTASFDVLALTRDAGTNRPLVLDSNTLAPVFNSNATGFDFEPGGRAYGS